MTDHLPECQDALIPDWENERWICICKYLRACEQRVLDAAREALVIAERRLHFDGDDNRWIVEIDAIAAIDALKEKP